MNRIEAAVRLSDGEQNELAECALSLAGIPCTRTSEASVVIADPASVSTGNVPVGTAALIVLYPGSPGDRWLRSPTHLSLRERFGNRYTALRQPVLLEELIRETRRLLYLAADPSDAAGSGNFDAAESENGLFDAEAGELIRNGTVVRFTDCEARLFGCLLRQNGSPVSREEILREVWGKRAPSGNAVEVYVSYLRKKLSPLFGQAVLGSVRGQGYVLNLTGIAIR